MNSNMSLRVHKKRKTNEKTEGFALVESFVSIVVLMVALVGPLALSQRSLVTSVVAKDEVTATYLAQDVVEFVKQVRDTNRASGLGWIDSLSVCDSATPCVVDMTLTPLNDPSDAITEGPVDETVYYNSTTGQYGHQSGAGWEATKFRRNLTVDTVSATEAVAKITVEWDTALGIKDVAFTQSLFNLSGSTGGGGVGLVAHWPMDTTAGGITPDIVGGYDGDVNGTVPIVTGAIDEALAFDSASDYINVLAIEPANVDQNEARTMTAWIKAGTQSTNRYFYWHESDCIGWYLRLNGSGTIRGNFRTGTNCADDVQYTVTASDPTRYDDNNWHFVVLIIDRLEGEMQLYVDATLKDTIAIDNTGSGVGSSNSLRIGTNGGGALFFDGLIDDVRLYDRGLIDSEILELYEEVPPTSGLIGRWDFEECSGPNAIDTSPIGNDGTYVGSPAWVSGAGAKVGACAINFNGNDAIDLPPNAVYGDALSFTIASWVWLTPKGGIPVGDQGEYPTILDHVRLDTGDPDSCYDNQFSMYRRRSVDDSGGMGEIWARWSAQGGSCTPPVSSRGRIFVPYSEWHHVAATYEYGGAGANDGIINLYLDGELQSFANYGSLNVPVGAAGDLSLTARYSLSGSDRWYGRLDDLRLYNRALASSEVCTLYKDQSGSLTCP
jgi:Tfp pilus assembly protein PilV